MRITGRENKSTSIHSFQERGVIEKTSFMLGMYKIKQCKAKLKVAAKIKYGLTQGGTDRMDISSLRALKALNISMATNTVKERVLAFAFPVAEK